MVGDVQPRQFSYLLRVWSVEQNGTEVWRASLESPQTGERTGFADLDALLAFLRQSTASAPDGRAAGASLRRRVG